MNHSPINPTESTYVGQEYHFSGLDISRSLRIENYNSLYPSTGYTVRFIFHTSQHSEVASDRIKGGVLFHSTRTLPLFILAAFRG
jgi:hypothetical protein